MNRAFVVVCGVVLFLGITIGIGNKDSYGGEVVNPLCRIPEWREYCGPHFVVIGSMKCGTTSLFGYLLSHPQVLPLKDRAKIMGKPVTANKEVRFFMDPTYSQAASGDKSHSEMLDIYYDIFPDISPIRENQDLSMQSVTGEATPMYVVSRI